MTTAADIQSRIRAALDRTDPTYLQKTLLSRSENRAGSYVENQTAESLRRLIENAAWQPFTHPALDKSVTAFKAAIPGVLGMIAAKDLPPETPLKLEDPKGTGFLSAFVSAAENIRRPRVDFSIIMLGPADDDGREIVYTFHPGNPVALQSLSAQEAPVTQITAAELLRLRPAMQVKITEAASAHKKTPRP